MAVKLFVVAVTDTSASHQRERFVRLYNNFCFGTGDGNLHLNITSEAYDFTLLKKIEPFVYEWVSREHGSVSAEHGLGFKKRGYIGFSKSESSIEWMYQIKKLFDPNNILNPYKVLPDTPDLLNSTGKAVM